VFALVEDDLDLPTEFQKRMVARQSPGVEVEAMAAADPMAMLAPRQDRQQVQRVMQMITSKVQKQYTATSV
jgi:hypothetical protein